MDYSTNNMSPSWEKSREAMLAYQQRCFRKLLAHVWKRSAFYRNYYGSYGLREKDLNEATIRDLPFVSKQILMENFDAAVTDPRLRKKELEQWIENHRNPRGLEGRQDLRAVGPFPSPAKD